MAKKQSREAVAQAIDALKHIEEELTKNIELLEGQIWEAKDGKRRMILKNPSVCSVEYLGINNNTGQCYVDHNDPEYFKENYALKVIDTIDVSFLKLLTLNK